MATCIHLVNCNLSFSVGGFHVGAKVKKFLEVRGVFISISMRCGLPSCQIGEIISRSKLHNDPLSE